MIVISFPLIINVVPPSFIFIPYILMILDRPKRKTTWRIREICKLILQKEREMGEGEKIREEELYEYVINTFSLYFWPRVFPVNSISLYTIRTNITCVILKIVLIDIVLSVQLGIEKSRYDSPLHPDYSRQDIKIIKFISPIITRCFIFKLDCCVRS